MARFLRTHWRPALIGLAMGLLVTLMFTQLHSTATHNCRQIENIKTQIRRVVWQGDRTLGKPGSAGYAYYRAHPAELALAHRAAGEELQTFRPSRC